MSQQRFRITHSDRIADIDFDEGKPVLRCPYNWYESTVNEAASQENEYNSQGLAGHKLAYDYGLHCVRTRQVKDMHYFDQLLAQRTDGGLFGYEFEARDDFYQTAYNFVNAVMFKPNHEHHFESRFAFERGTYRRLKLVEGDGRYNITEPVQYIAGTVDHFSIDKVKWHGYLTDYKMGYRNIDDWKEAETNMQLMLYSWACFKLWPELQEITATLWGPMWGRNNKAVANFKREETIAKVEAWLDYQWLVLDQLWDEYGENPWPANECGACEYCSLVCPKYEATADQYPEYTEKVKAA